MIRVVLYLVVVGLLAMGAAWLADRPGDVLITWQGRRIETSVMVLIMFVMAFATLAVMLWSIARAILRSPDILSAYLRTRRSARGYLALSQGLVAVGSGEGEGGSGRLTWPSDKAAMARSSFFLCPSVTPSFSRSASVRSGSTAKSMSA